MTSTSYPRIARSWFHRAFFQWLHENQSRFLTAPLRLVKRTDRCMEFTIPGLNPGLSFTLTTWVLGVHVEWQGVWWDALVFFECCPEAVADGYICHLCDSEDRKIYSSREALWIEHDFELFLEWVNTKLAPSHWLNLHGELNACTWAELANDSNPKAIANERVWLA